MRALIDLHTHLLPAMDDGAKDIEESLRMLADSFAQGVRTCVATPHCVIHRQGDIARFLERRAERFAALQRAMPRQDCPELLLGAEVYLDNDISEYDNLEELCLAGTRFLLVEFPVTGFGYRLADWLYALKLKGIHPLIAHVDRYPDWEKLLDDFDGLKLRYQVNASRLLNFWGRRLFQRLRSTGEFFVVSSDMHNMTTRRCNMREARAWADRRLPEEARDLFENHARQILME